MPSRDLCGFGQTANNICSFLTMKLYLLFTSLKVYNCVTSCKSLNYSGLVSLLKDDFQLVEVIPYS